MTANEFDEFEPALAAALASMLKESIGPAFDLDDVRNALGTDPSAIHASGESESFESAMLAMAAAVRRMPTHLNRLRRARGVVACVTVGPHAPAFAAVKTVAALLRVEASEDASLVCGARIDQSFGKDVSVMLWTR